MRPASYGKALFYLLMGLSALFFGWADLLGNQAEYHGQHHVRQGVTHRRVHAHQQAVGDEAHQPDDQIAGIGGYGKAVAL